MAPLTMATFPLQSCRMGFSLNFVFCVPVDQRLRGWGEAVDGNGSGLGAAIEADAAAGAACAGVVRRVHAISVQFRQQFEALGGTGFDAQSTALAFLGIDQDVTTCRYRHTHLVATAA